MRVRLANILYVVVALGVVWHTVRVESMHAERNHLQESDAPVVRVASGLSASASDTVNTVGRTVVVPAGDLLMIASLDVKANRHALSLAAHESWVPESSGQDTAATVVEWRDIRVTPPVPQRSYTGTDQLTEVLPSIVVDSERTQRRFDSPYFSGGLAQSRFVMGIECVHCRTVRIFTDKPSESVFRKAQFVAAVIDNGLLGYVENRIAPIVDVDEDGYLTVLLTDLSDDSITNALSTDAPINGCVRGRDFLDALSEFGGDIIYVDVDLSLDDAAAVIAHELSHAATFSVQRQCAATARYDVPCWLNEAIAHSIERSVQSDSANLRERINEFRRRPYQFPIVIPDNCRTLSLRRGPARAASCLFLEATLSRHRSDSQLLEALICASVSTDSPLTQVFGESLEELIRTWGAEYVKNTSDVPQVKLTFDRATDVALSGTAILWVAPSASQRCVEIVSPNDCQIQPTLIRNN